MAILAYRQEQVSQGVLVAKQMTNLKGMNRVNGTVIDKDEHIIQSINDILTTPIGSRVMRREYGSLIPFLIDEPVNFAFIMKLKSAIVHAIMRWEKRIIPIRIELRALNNDHSQFLQGKFDLWIEYQHVLSKKTAEMSLSLGGAL